MKIRKRLNLTTKARSKLSEKRTAKFLGGKVQPASGALPFTKLKGDVITDDFLVDDKITTKISYSLTLKLWRKHANDARTNGRSPVVRVCFTDGPTLYVLDELGLAKLLDRVTANDTCQRSSPAKPLPLRRSSRRSSIET